MEGLHSDVGGRTWGQQQSPQGNTTVVILDSMHISILVIRQPFSLRHQEYDSLTCLAGAKAMAHLHKVVNDEQDSIDMHSSIQKHYLVFR
jgi:hypothetical protein